MGFKQGYHKKQNTVSNQPKRLSNAIAYHLKPGLFALALIAPPAMSATFTVNSTADPGDGTCDASCSLRDAIIASNGAAGSDIIDLTGVSGTINLASSLDTINQSVAINGPGAANLSIDGGGNFRIFRIEPSGVAPQTISTSISGLTMQNAAADAGPAPNFYYCGGAIKNYGEDLSVSDSVITSNTADFGAGICSRSYYSSAGIGGSLTISNTTISGNSAATFAGGGVYASHITGSVSVDGSTISGNTSGYFGGGLAIHGQNIEVTVSNSSILSNTALGSGGGMDLVGSNSNLTIDGNSVIDGNIASGAANVFGVNYCANGVGGGILVYQLDPGVVTISGNTQITGNSVFAGTAPGGSCPMGRGVGGGIWALQMNASGSFTLDSSTVSNNFAANFGGGLFLNETGTATTISQSTISGNTANVVGGGSAFLQLGGTLDIAQTSLSGNTAPYGGGLYAFLSSSSTTISQSTIDSNTSSMYGGGAYINQADSDLSMVNSTISGNSAGGLSGSGLVILFFDLTSAVTLSHSTLFQNTLTVPRSASSVGELPMARPFRSADNPMTIRGGTPSSIFAVIPAGGNNVLLDHTIVGGSGGPELTGSFDVNFSLVEDTTGAIFPNGTASLLTGDPMLNPLANNGGLTLTHTPVLNGPSVDTGDPAFTAPPNVDQTGAPRVQGPAVDMGSYETQAGGVPPLVEPISVPTLSQWGIILMAMLLPLTAAFGRRKKKQ